MNTFIMIFAFVPVLLAFMVNGPGGSEYVFKTLVLFWAMVEIVSTKYWVISLRNLVDTLDQFDDEYNAAMVNWDAGRAEEVLRAKMLFLDSLADFTPLK